MGSATIYRRSFIPNTELNYLNARYYDGYRGQFVSIDPMFWSPEKFLMDPQSLNAYSYARNNPIILIDANGNMWSVGDTGIFLVGVGTSVAIGVGVVALVAAAPILAPVAAVAGGIALAYGAYEAGSAAVDSYNRGGWSGLYNDTATYIDENPFTFGTIVGGAICVGVCGSGGKYVAETISSKFISSKAGSSIAETIANGHAFDKHVMGVGNQNGKEFGSLIQSREEFSSYLNKVIKNPSDKFITSGRGLYWDDKLVDNGVSHHL